MQAVRLQQRQYQSQELPEDEDLMELMTANLLKINRNITQRNEHSQIFHSQALQQHQFLKNESMAATSTPSLAQQIRQSYQAFLNNIKLPNNHQQKLQYLLQSQQMGLGVSVALFQMLYYFRDVISDEVLTQITEKAFSRIKLMDSKLSNAQRVCLLELIAICGVYDEQFIEYVVQEMLKGTVQFQLSFLVLSNMGYKGLQMLVNIARQDIKQTPIRILNLLAQTQEVLKQLLVPTLIQDLIACKNKGRQKDIILSIINRLNQIVSSNRSIFPLLVQLMHNNVNSRGFIVSILRSLGNQGEKILLQFMNQFQNNQKMMLPIVSVLPWRAPAEPVIRIKVIQYTFGSNFMPGTLYQYEGNIQPSAFCFQQDDGKCCDSLCINARDFIAALNRMLNFKRQNFENQEYIRKNPVNNLHLFTLHSIVGKIQGELPQISSDVVKALNKCLLNSKPEIRQAAINSLGLIGLPQAYQSIEQVTKCMWDKDSRIRSIACEALAKICENQNKKIINRLLQLLKDNFWKVRISACICLGAVVSEPQQNVLEALVKCLRDNSINKVTVCETLMRMRTVGEQILVEILKSAGKSDFKLKEAIIYALREADVKSPHIDFVLEEVFRCCKGTRVETRICCLQTLNCLRVKAAEEGENIVYLKAKNILPFYYYFLEDPILKIRQMATQSIFSFGSQAELIFIDGIAKGSQMVRIQSAKGLARLGVQNFRALVLGLRDQDAQVRETSTAAILNNFAPEEVGSYYSSKTPQIPSLLCNLKDILSGGGLSQSMKKFIKQVIVSLQKISKGYDECPFKISDENQKSMSNLTYGNNKESKIY